MINIISFIQNKYIIAFIVSLIFSILYGSGLMGYGPDYFSSYGLFNIAWGNLLRDQIGNVISSLNIFNIYLGSSIVTFFTCFATSLLIIKYLEINKKDVYEYCLSIVMINFSWPIILLSLNVMRQGLVTSIFYLYIFLNYKKFNVFTIFLLISIPSLHYKISIILLITCLTHIFYYYICKFIENIKIFNYSLFILSFVVYGIIYFYLKNNIYLPDNFVRGVDLSLIFLIINISYSYFFIFFLYKNKNFLESLLFIYSLILPCLYFLELFWQFERFNMLSIIPYIFIFSKFLSYKHKVSIFLIFSSLLLFFSYFVSNFYTTFI